MRILVVDDDETLGETMREILSFQNLDVDWAVSAPDGLAKINVEHYDVVLVDYVMPDHDGLWFMSNAKLPRSTKALLMTGHLDRKVINEMFNLGACGYIIKPFDEEELLHNLNYFLPGKISA